MPPEAQNYILYRTKALTWQPPAVTAADGTSVTPDVVVASPVGAVVATQMLTDTNGISVRDGFAYALDADGKYPEGSIYTPKLSTGYTLSGTSTATAGMALMLTLAPDNDGPGTSTKITLSDGNAGGTFSADTVTFDGYTNTPQTVTYTPKAVGTVTISATNTGGLTNPASLNLTVGAAVAS